jgi:type I restriction-modification system DNA methylase subunit
MSLSDVPDIILKLIERFEEQKDTYMSGGYNETQVRRDFIDPFFKALGWDIDNENGYAEAYRDVIHEDMVLVGSTKKAPDYSFRIGGTRKFFVEAKKPSVSINLDPKPAFQLRRYGWSAKLPISILTDFEEFAVYDCTHKPDEKHGASRARLYYFKYSDYVEKWAEIASLFSKQAVMKGSFDRFAASKKKGTTAVDDAFLAEIEQWRQDLARNILENNVVTQRDLNLAVQLIIDRIIFLRICEDRGIENYERLFNLSKRKNVYQQLGNFFKDADDRYNSGLFNFDPKDIHATPADTITLKLKVDDEPLRKIIESLYLPNPYEFSVIPADILGQVYERFLGKVIIIDGKTLKVEEKPEVKKAGGVYYTPSYIVEYIVKHTVDKLLVGKTPKQVEKIKILDPACGSGSFLIVAYQHVLDWYLNYYATNGGIAKFKKELHETDKGMLRLTTQIRKSILLNNIYGVDIDAQAVEVTKLSLLLKVLEGESGETISKNLTFFKERALPDLGNNVKCGNSLVGSEFYAQDELPDFLEEDHYRINSFDWKEEFKDIFKGGGFDVVVGNPPFGATLYPLEKAFLKYKFKNQSYQLDSYLLFMEHTIILLLKKSGKCGMIIPNTWLTNITQGNIRKFILERTSIELIVHFNYPVFKQAVVDTEIVVFSNEFKKHLTPEVQIANNEKDFIENSAVETIYGNQDDWIKNYSYPINVFMNQNQIDLRNKIFSAPLRLSDLFKINVGIKPYQIGKGRPHQDIQTVENRIFDAKKQISSEYRLYLRGRDIGKFCIKPLENRWIRYGEWLAEPRPAADFDAVEKIFIRQTGDEVIAALDRQQFLCLNNLHVLVPIKPISEITGILALLNSRLMTWCLRSMNPETGEALAEVKKQFISMLPLPNLCNLGEFSKHADGILKLSNANIISSVNTKQIKIHMNSIDQLTYEAFGLTEEEIDIVES